MKPFIRNSTNVIVASFYINSDSKQFDGDSKLQHVYVGATKEDIQRMVMEDYVYARQGFDEWLADGWGSLIYAQEDGTT